MKPELWTVIEGVRIYRVHKEGYGKGRPMTDWFSTSDSDRPVYSGQNLVTEHEACRFAIDSMMGKGLGRFSGMDEYHREAHWRSPVR